MLSKNFEALNQFMINKVYIFLQYYLEYDDKVKLDQSSLIIFQCISYCLYQIYTLNYLFAINFLEIQDL